MAHFVAKISGFIAETSSLRCQIFCRRKSFFSNSDCWCKARK